MSLASTTAPVHHVAGATVISRCLESHSRAPAHPKMTKTLRHVFGFSPLRPDARRWHGRALAQQKVARLLSELEPQWHVYHNVIIDQDQHLDHLVIGPSGIFALAAHHHPRANVWVSQRTYVINSKICPPSVFEAETLAAMSKEFTTRSGLRLSAQAMMVIVDPYRLEVKQHPDDVTVISSHALVQHLRNAPAVLSSQDIDRVMTVLSKDLVLTPRVADADQQQLLGNFLALHQKVRSARQRAVGWWWALSVVLASALGAEGVHLVSNVIDMVS